MKSMKLIMEAFRKHINEDVESASFFGNNFVDFKEDLLAGEPIVQTAVKHFGQPIGIGSTRIVFNISEDFILKIINIVGNPTAAPGEIDAKGFDISNKTKSNEYEKDLTIQQNFPDVFPRTFESADDNTWLVAEKVKPFKDHEALLRYLDFHGPFDRKDYIPSRELAYRFVKEEMEGTPHGNGTEQLMESTINLGLRNTDDDTSIRAAPRPQQPPQRFVAPMYLQPEKIQMAHAMLKNPEMKKIIRAAVLMDIPPRELKGANIGISNITNKLVMLDMSLWD